MHDSQWLDHHGKRKNYLWLVILIAAVFVAAGIFIRNNSDVLGVSRGQKKEPAEGAAKATQAPAAVPAPSPAPAAVEKQPAVLPQAKTTAPPKVAAPAAAPAAPSAAKTAKTPAQAASPATTVNESVPLERITCRLMDKSQPSIRLSLALSFPANGALKQEILVKRDNLKIMVQKTLSAKSLDDMVVDSLRRGLLSCLNSVLENGAITDIEFKEFRIEKVE
jgi:flagellar basal body-associated protein FliL